MFDSIYRAADITKRLSFLTLFLLIGIGPLAAVGSSAVLPAPTFSGDARLEQTVPYLNVAWSSPAQDQEQQVHFELQMDGSPDFLDTTTRYRGPDRASFVAGLAEGEYFFRVRAFEPDGATGPWSDSLHVIIEYDSLAKAFLLFGIGAVVSIATIALVVVGDRRTRREEEANSQ